MNIEKPNTNQNISQNIEPHSSRIGRTYEQIWHERSIRVTKDPRTRITMYSPENNFHKNVSEMAITGIHEKSILNQLYFSPQNFKNVQNMIRYKIYVTSDKKYIIDKQDPLELQVIMRSIYLQYSRNNYTNVKEQIKRLNEIVVEEVTPKILANVQQYLTYLKDRSKPFYGRGPIERPISVSNAGLKSLRIDTAIGF
jgi:hypothetical protein